MSRMMKEVICLLIYVFDLSSKLPVICYTKGMKKDSKVIKWIIDMANSKVHPNVIQWKDGNICYCLYDGRGQNIEKYPQPWKTFYEMYDQSMDPTRCVAKEHTYYTEAKGRFHNCLSRLVKSGFLEVVKPREKIDKSMYQTIYKIKEKKQTSRTVRKQTKSQERISLSSDSNSLDKSFQDVNQQQDIVVEEKLISRGDENWMEDNKMDILDLTNLTMDPKDCSNVLLEEGLIDININLTGNVYDFENEKCDLGFWDFLYDENVLFLSS